MKIQKKTKIILTITASITAILLFLFLFAFVINKWSVTLVMNEEETCTIEYGDTYTDPGATAYFHGSLIFKDGFSVPVNVSGTVDPTTLGTYKLTYTAKKYRFSATAERTIVVKDTVAPTITLKSSPDTYTLPGHSYDEEGFAASDNYDGDITKHVSSKEKDGIVTYTVSDSSGNKTSVTRKIKYDDPTPPVLTLSGETKLSLQAGSSYTEPGYHATDNCDGNLTSKVTIDGSVDTMRAGTYTLTYRVKDSYGNTTTATRQITVNAIKQPDVVAPSGKVIYLTFDDGPGPYTDQLLNVLAKYNVKATFFVVNGQYNHLIAKEAAAGHSVGIHSLTHDYSKIYSSESAFFDDLHAMESIIQTQTGKRPTLTRFPGGSSNQVSARYNKGIMTRLTKAVTDQGYQYFDWNITSGDAGETTDTNTVFQNVINGVKQQNASIVLQHDSKGFSVNAVEKIIVWGLANGYTFLPLNPSSPAVHHSVFN